MFKKSSLYEFKRYPCSLTLNYIVELTFRSLALPPLPHISDKLTLLSGRQQTAVHLCFQTLLYSIFPPVDMHILNLLKTLLQCLMAEENECHQLFHLISFWSCELS